MTSPILHWFHSITKLRGSRSVPDAAIRSSTALWFETKTESNAVDQDQLQRHLHELDEGDADLQRLIVLTPDHERPTQIAAIDDDRLVWVNFDSVITAIEGVLERDAGSAEQTASVPTEREAFLLRELVRFLYDEELADQVTIGSNLPAPFGSSMTRSWLAARKIGSW